MSNNWHQCLRDKRSNSSTTWSNDHINTEQRCYNGADNYYNYYKATQLCSAQYFSAVGQIDRPVYTIIKIAIINHLNTHKNQANVEICYLFIKHQQLIVFWQLMLNQIVGWIFTSNKYLSKQREHMYKLVYMIVTVLSCDMMLYVSLSLLYYHCLSRQHE